MKSDWATNWDAVHEATERICFADYTELETFHHRVLLAILDSIPSDVLLPIIADREQEIMAKIAARKQKEQEVA